MHLRGTENLGTEQRKIEEKIGKRITRTNGKTENGVMCSKKSECELRKWKKIEANKLNYAIKISQLIRVCIHNIKLKIALIANPKTFN